MSLCRIFIGYPGFGKSTLINYLERKVVFESVGSDKKALKDDIPKNRVAKLPTSRFLFKTVTNR